MARITRGRVIRIRSPRRCYDAEDEKSTKHQKNHQAPVKSKFQAPIGDRTSGLADWNFTGAWCFFWSRLDKKFKTGENAGHGRQCRFSGGFVVEGIWACFSRF